MKFKLTLVSVMLLLFALAGRAQEPRLHFRAGDLHRVQITEVLKLFMHFPQVERVDQKPSIRTTDYSFTESVDSVLPDGSAIIGATLDSFKTKVVFGEGKNAENFFSFNSSIEYDLAHNFRDIKTLPRAQFLGQTLHFTMRPDGTVHDFVNLSEFHQNAVGQGYDYDMVHAMLSLADSVRIGQLLELGFGGLAAKQNAYTSPTTATEIPLTRTVTSHGTTSELTVSAHYSDAPPRIEYLEGIATPMGILKFSGGGQGTIVMKNGFIQHSVYRDTANVLLAIDIDTVPEEITRLVTTTVTSIPRMRAGKNGSRITIKEIESHEENSTDPRMPSDTLRTMPADTTERLSPSH